MVSASTQVKGVRALLIYVFAFFIAPALYDLVNSGAQGISWLNAAAALAIEILVLWRVWRAGRIAWIIGILYSIYQLLTSVLLFIWPWNVSAALNIAGALGQLAILLSPPIRRHVVTRVDHVPQIGD